MLWLRRDPRRGPVLNVAPMSVAMLVRDRVFSERTCVLTSATLELGGSFDAVAGTIGLRGDGARLARHRRGEPVRLPAAGHRLRRPRPPRTRPRRDVAEGARRDRGAGPRRRPDVGAVLLDAGGPERGGAAAGPVRVGQDSDPDPVPGRGPDLDSGTPVRARAGDVPLRDAHAVARGRRRVRRQLVVIDRIPFPRPDDLLASARSEAIARMGGTVHGRVRHARGPAARAGPDGWSAGPATAGSSPSSTRGWSTPVRQLLQRSLPPSGPRRTASSCSRR